MPVQPFVLSAIMAAVQQITAPLRSASSTSRITTVQTFMSVGTGTYTTQMTRVPFVVAVNLTELVITTPCGWFLQAFAGVTPMGNDVFIESMALEYNNTSTPIRFGGSRSITLPNLSAPLLSDPVQASSLGASQFTNGVVGWVRIRARVLRGQYLPDCSGNILTGSTNRLSFDPDKVNFTNGIDGTGTFAYEMVNGGVNGTDIKFAGAELPVLILGRHNLPVVGFFGDSKTAGEGDTAPVATRSAGLTRALFPSISTGTGAKPGINFAHNSGRALDCTSGSYVAKLTELYKYITHAVVGYGTNQISFSAQQALHSQLRANNIQKIIQMSLTPRTTGTFTSAAGQTKNSSWVTGGAADVFEGQLRGLVSSDPDMTYYNPSSVRDSVDGGDYWLWRSTGGVARTADGLHENPQGFEDNVGGTGQIITQAGTTSGSLRSLVQALYS